MPRKYYGLFVQHEPGKWEYAFGDYDKKCVDFEFDDMRDHGFKLYQLKLIKWEQCPKDWDIELTRMNLENPK